MVEIFRMKVEKSHMKGSKLRLPSDSKIDKLPKTHQVFSVSDNQNTWNCRYEESSDGRHYLHVDEQWDDFKVRINGREISLRKGDDHYSGGAPPSYKFEVSN
ncbi:hypothetical protein SLA2020_170330 [Shorea laevis]